MARPGQYLGNEWGTSRKSWESALVHLALAFPDIYELGMSNFGQRILYQLVNEDERFLADRTYAPASDMEAILRERNLPLWGWESRYPLNRFELIGFSLAYELTYTNVLNMLELAGIPVFARERQEIFPLVFGGGPSTVNPEPMADFMDFYIIGDGEEAVPAVMSVVSAFKKEASLESPEKARKDLLFKLATEVPGVYVPSAYEEVEGQPHVKPVSRPGTDKKVPERVARQVCPLTDKNQPTEGIVSYLSLVHDRQVMEVRRGCDRGCRFCQPGYSFLPVRERSTEDLLKLSKKALETSGHDEYSMLSLCVSDYTALHESVRTLNREHKTRRASMSFPSQRADRMNFDIAEELKSVRKSGITLAPEAGSERLRAVINKGLNHTQIISAIETAYKSGWNSVKLYFMLGLPTERDEDLLGILDILKEATQLCKQIRRQDPEKHKRPIEFTCTMSNFVPKPFTPFQWYGQITRAETLRRHRFMKNALKEYKLPNATLNFTDVETSLLESVISRADRSAGKLIYNAWRAGAVFDAWDDRFKPEIWHETAACLGLDLEQMSCTERVVGSKQAWDVVHVGLADWWLVKEWEKAMAVEETAPCTENTCHACGVCTELDTHHILADPKPEVVKKNPFVKELATFKDESEDSHPSLFFTAPPEQPQNEILTKIKFEMAKTGDMRFIGHLDLMHLLSRAARRAGLNVAHTEGFNPRPKIALAVSLQLFQEGLHEAGEIDLAESLTAEEFVSRMNSQLPPEIRIGRAKVMDVHSPSLATLVERARYTAVAKEGAPSSGGTDGFVPQAIEKKVEEVMSGNTLEIAVAAPKGKRRNRRSRRGSTPKKSTRDIRSGIYSIEVGKDAPLTLTLEIAAGPKMHVKPTDLLHVIDPNISWRVTREFLATADGVNVFEI